MPLLSQSFSSTAITFGSYDTDTEELSLTFTSGQTYTYDNVPEHIWDGLVAARSAGGYFASQIKNRY